ncbi:MAG: transporter [Deltaproteobacteria bacterium]|nr:transporter [Deltaproteobacteria bacterium]
MKRVLIALLVLLLAGVSFNAFGQEVEKKPLPSGVPVERGGALLPTGRFILEPSLQYTHYSQETVSISGFTIFEAILIGKIDVKKIERDIFIPSLTARLGFENLELNLKAPWLYRQDQTLEQVEEEQKEITIHDSGLGDIEGGIYYHLVKEKETMPDVIVNLGFKAPTGKDPYGLKTEVVEEGTPARAVEFPTGTGHWGFSGGFIFVKTTDPAILSLNISYFYNAPRNVGIEGDINYGKIDPGDSIECGLGMLFALNEKLSLQFSYDQKFTGKSKQNGKKLVGTGANTSVLNIGVTYAISNKLSFDTVIGIGLTEDAPDVSVQFKFPITFRF